MDDTTNNKTHCNCKAYRQQLGFTNQQQAKSFLSAKDIKPAVNMAYLAQLNQRLLEIVRRLNSLQPQIMPPEDEKLFYQLYIEDAFHIIVDHNILTRLNNQGRRPEQVYFSWMRGYIILNYFKKALAAIFGTDISKIVTIGNDDLAHIETFARAATADLEFTTHQKQRIRLEVQSGFQGINDIKLHKVIEARRAAQTERVKTLVVHFDIYNGQVAIVRIDNIRDGDKNWITRKQMEGQTVFNIGQAYFIWQLSGPRPTADQIASIING